ncbi:MAG: peptide chain release factor-like protein [Verrucomicrobia bacterium]|nr:peptide chain release factor-like protein [Verrucomicrobiota bacterium]
MNPTGDSSDKNNQKHNKWVHPDDKDLEETFSRSSGPGGQNVNKVSTKVTLRHIPTGLTVSEQGSRSQLVNRQVARQKLIQILQEAQETARQTEIQEAEKARRRNSPRPKKLKRRIRESKVRRSQIKSQRKKVRSSRNDE